MQQESDLTPFAPGRLDGSPVLVLAPHPDDEVFGCGGVLVQAVAAGTVRLVILTDGRAQGDAETRRQEAEEAARRLGLPAPELWGLADRSLDPADLDLRERLRALILETRPEVILVPSPAEIHPDHRALALQVYRILQEATPGSELHEALQAVRLAAYEVSSVLRPNLLVDVSKEWKTVIDAAKAYASQLEQLPYLEVLQAIATARRLTLPSTVRQAEAYHAADLRYIRTHSAAEWAAAQGPSSSLEVATDTAPIDVVVRTRNRPQLLRQALDSLLAQLQPPARVIVVNDGGVSVTDEVSSRLGERLDWELVDHKKAKGRAAAAQAGLERATASHVVFLDDDDLLLPEHLLTLGQAVAAGATAPYTDAVQGIWRSDPDTGELRPLARHRTFGGAFIADRFAVINHIPLPTVAIPREMALQLGGFDRKVDLYEDWDLLLRLAEQTPLVHIPRITCEYRVLADSDGITAANPPGSPGQLAALVATWRRHGVTRSPKRLAAGVMALMAERDRAAEQVRLLDEQLLETRGMNAGLTAEHQRQCAELDRLTRRANGLQAELERLEFRVAELRDENSRLNGLLEKIYASKTWRLHLVAERLRGRSQE